MIQWHRRLLERTWRKLKEKEKKKGNMEKEGKWME
jgi:hypothetical protein